MNNETIEDLERQIAEREAFQMSQESGEITAKREMPSPGCSRHFTYRIEKDGCFYGRVRFHPSMLSADIEWCIPSELERDPTPEDAIEMVKKLMDDKNNIVMGFCKARRHTRRAE